MKRTLDISGAEMRAPEHLESAQRIPAHRQHTSVSKQIKVNIHFNTQT